MLVKFDNILQVGVEHKPRMDAGGQVQMQPNQTINRNAPKQTIYVNPSHVLGVEMFPEPCGVDGKETRTLALLLLVQGGRIADMTPAAAAKLFGVS